MLVRFKGKNASGAVVLTVTVWVPLPPFTIGELKLHVGGTAVTGLMAQLKLTIELNPPDGTIVTLEVAELPTLMLAGENGVAVIEKDGVAAAATVRLACVV
jgi:hypothetical protein